ncbi:hypothetical protein [Ralstonia pseudosolanacearum]|uniref:hypothetical protein n=1 Tax=Ralstonia pseudosolanacearum TaxID=1310165 RepID=UPI00160F61AB|nr:hypothetical protein [Ralstonia pseudosolanacearum]
MTADKLGRFMTSPAFLQRANALIKQAVHTLETRGIQPAYIHRPPRQQQTPSS